MLLKAENATALELSSTLCSLADVGWYDAAVYDALLASLASRVKEGDSQKISNSLYAYGLAQHDRSMMCDCPNFLLCYSGPV
jgi:hypothetical protein